MRTDAPEAGFLGAPVETDLDHLEAEVAILGIPHGWPYPDPGPAAGCAAAPSAIRRRSLRLARFRGHWDFDLGAPFLPDDAGWRLVDAGDVPGEPRDGPGNSERAEAAVRAILERGAVPVVLGGDDSTPIPFLRAFAGRGPITVIQVDAHLDFRHEVDGVREGYSSPMRRASEMGHVATVVQVGLRGVGSARPEDVDAARAAGHRLVPAAALRRDGVQAAVVGLLPPDARVVLAFDADGLDPSVCPGVAAPAPGGLSYREAWELIAGIGPRLAGAIFTELLPDRDPGEIGALSVARLACAAIAAAGPRSRG